MTPPAKMPMRDRRLLGTWRSDARRTLKGWVFPPRMSAARRERFARIFGKLVIRYTPTRIISEFRGEQTVERYRVLGRDPGSVAIFAWENDRRLGQITHIHFNKKHYWVLTSAVSNVEFFQR